MDDHTHMDMHIERGGRKSTFTNYWIELVKILCTFTVSLVDSWVSNKSGCLTTTKIK